MNVHPTRELLVSGLQERVLGRGWGGRGGGRGRRGGPKQLVLLDHSQSELYVHDGANRLDRVLGLLAGLRSEGLDRLAVLGCQASDGVSMAVGGGGGGGACGDAGRLRTLSCLVADALAQEHRVVVRRLVPLPFFLRARDRRAQVGGRLLQGVPALPRGDQGPGFNPALPPKAVRSRCATGAAARMTLRAAAFVSCTWVAAEGRGRIRRGDN